jgi:hypothetical protein
MTPSAAVPVPYVAGTLTVPANTVMNVLALIQAQLAPNCPGTAVEFQINADATNTGNVYVGAASQFGGAVSASNWAYQLTPGGEARGYRSTYPGTNTPLGEIEVFSPAPAILHIELQA